MKQSKISDKRADRIRAEFNEAVKVSEASKDWRVPIRKLAILRRYAVQRGAADLLNKIDKINNLLHDQQDLDNAFDNGVTRAEMAGLPTENAGALSVALVKMRQARAREDRRDLALSRMVARLKKGRASRSKKTH
jgi:hypothetical protein